MVTQIFSVKTGQTKLELFTSLFIFYCLFSNAVNSSDYTVSNDRLITTEQLIGKHVKWLWPNMRYYPA